MATPTTKEDALKGIDESFVSSTPEQTKALRQIRASFGGTEPKTEPLPVGGRQAGSLVENQGKEGFDVFGNPVEGFVPRVTRTAQDIAIDDTLSAPLKTETTEEIQARKTKEAQAEIDALNRLFADKLREQTERNVVREREGASISTLTGLAGSTQANVEQRKVEGAGAKQLDAIRNQQAVAIQGVLSDIRESAVEEARLQREEARQSAGDLIALRQERSKKAIDNIKVLAQSGVTSKGLKENDPEAYNQLVKTLGSEALVDGYLALNRPVDTLLDSRVINGQYITVFQNPITGAITQEIVDLGLPVGYTKLADAGDKILFAPENWDGSTEDLITINKGLTPAQALKGVEDITADTDVSELDPTSQSILAQTGLSIPAYSFLTTGVKALTRMSSGDRKKFMAEAEKWSIDNNIDISTFQSEFQAFNEVVQRNIKISALVGLAGEDIKGSLAELTRLTEKEGFGDIKITNVIKIVAGEQLGDPVALQYKFILDDLRSAISGFFAVQQGRTSTMDSDRVDAKELINNGLASGSISGLINTINTVSQRTERIADDSVGFAQDKIWEMFGVVKPVGIESQEGESSGTLTSPDGSQFINTSDLTPVELQEAKDAGWI